MKRDITLEAKVVAKFAAVSSVLDERGRRLWAAAESRSLGWAVMRWCRWPRGWPARPPARDAGRSSAGSSRATGSVVPGPGAPASRRRRRGSKRRSSGWSIRSRAAILARNWERVAILHPVLVFAIAAYKRCAAGESVLLPGLASLALMRRSYFDAPEIDVLNRTFFSFAAYNAGPGNVRKARKRASRLGLDPNVWFDNEEIAMAQTVSREPVVYVRNILKYDVAFSLLVSDHAQRNASD